MSQNSFTNPVNAMLDRADPAIQAVQHAAHQAVDSLSQSAHGLQADASRLGQRSIDALRHSSQQMRDSAHRAGDRTLDYVREEPVKSMLIAAATGAALMALVGLLGRSRSGH